MVQIFAGDSVTTQARDQVSIAGCTFLVERLHGRGSMPTHEHLGLPGDGYLRAGNTAVYRGYIGRLGICDGKLVLTAAEYGEDATRTCALVAEFRTPKPLDFRGALVVEPRCISCSKILTGPMTLGDHSLLRNGIDPLPIPTQLQIVRAPASMSGRPLGEVWEVWPWESDLEVGRSDGSFFQLNDQSVSRRHALFRRDDAGVLSIHRLSADAHLTVNGQTVVDVAPLSPSTQIEIGPYSLLTSEGPLP